MPQEGLTQEQVEVSLAELDALCRCEYGCGLVDVLQGELAAVRLQRLTGVLLKKRFATMQRPDPHHNPTEAAHSWHWSIDLFDRPELQKTGEYDLLNQLRDAEGMPTWDHLASVTQERGLYKVLTLWLKDKLAGEQGKTFREYYYAKETPEFKSTLDIANTIVGGASAIASVVGVPTIAVNLALIACEYGYEKLVDAPERLDA
ncbi:MAG: hypothetical protein ACYTEZ_18705 [Planctomycetota bacterium]|jgi:hypothetical protein